MKKLKEIARTTRANIISKNTNNLLIVFDTFNVIHRFLIHSISNGPFECTYVCVLEAVFYDLPFSPSSSYEQNRCSALRLLLLNFVMNFFCLCSPSLSSFVLFVPLSRAFSLLARLLYSSTTIHSFLSFQPNQTSFHFVTLLSLFLCLFFAFSFFFFFLLLQIQLLDKISIQIFVRFSGTN